MISIVVDAAGMPRKVTPIRCSDPAFEKESLKVVSQYTFKPGTQQDGTPVAVQIHVEVNYRSDGFKNPLIATSYRVSPAPGTISNEPGVDGVYPLGSKVTPPAFARFSDEGYGNQAFNLPGGGACDVVLTVDAKGNASDASTTKCETPAIEKVALKSLLKSLYQPGTLNGVAVPVRVLIHLEFGGIVPSKWHRATLALFSANSDLHDRVA
jgi:hypothetical protein